MLPISICEDQEFFLSKEIHIFYTLRYCPSSDDVLARRHTHAHTRSRAHVRMTAFVPRSSCSESPFVKGKGYGVNTRQMRYGR